MKKIMMTTLAAAALSWASLTTAQAADETITGVASCAKGHETVIKVKQGDKLVTYHLAKNEAGKAFHAKICEKSAEVKATGEVKESDGMKVLTATKIELAKN